MKPSSEPRFFLVFSEIDKRGGSNEACIVGKIFSKRIRRTPYLLKTSE